MNDIDFNNIRPGKLSSSSEFHGNSSDSKLTRNSGVENLCSSDHSLKSESHPPREKAIEGHVGMNSGLASEPSEKQLNRSKVLDRASSKKLTSIVAPNVKLELNTSHDNSLTRKRTAPRAIAKRPHRTKAIFLVKTNHKIHTDFADCLKY